MISRLIRLKESTYGINARAKQQVVAEVSEVAANAYSAVAAEYHGIGVAKLTQLREQARDKGVVLKVVKIH